MKPDEIPENFWPQVCDNFQNSKGVHASISGSTHSTDFLSMIHDIGRPLMASSVKGDVMGLVRYSKALSYRWMLFKQHGLFKS